VELTAPGIGAAIALEFSGIIGGRAAEIEALPVMDRRRRLFLGNGRLRNLIDGVSRLCGGEAGNGESGGHQGGYKYTHTNSPFALVSVVTVCEASRDITKCPSRLLRN